MSRGGPSSTFGPTQNAPDATRPLHRCCIWATHRVAGVLGQGSYDALSARRSAPDPVGRGHEQQRGQHRGQDHQHDRDAGADRPGQGIPVRPSVGGSVWPGVPVSVSTVLVGVDVGVVARGRAGSATGRNRSGCRSAACWATRWVECSAIRSAAGWAAVALGGGLGRRHSVVGSGSPLGGALGVPLRRGRGRPRWPVARRPGRLVARGAGRLVGGRGARVGPVARRDRCRRRDEERPDDQSHDDQPGQASHGARPASGWAGGHSVGGPQLGGDSPRSRWIGRRASSDARRTSPSSHGPDWDRPIALRAPPRSDPARRGQVLPEVNTSCAVRCGLELSGVVVERLPAARARPG